MGIHLVCGGAVAEPHDVTGLGAGAWVEGDGGVAHLHRIVAGEACLENEGAHAAGKQRAGRGEEAGKMQSKHTSRRCQPISVVIDVYLLPCEMNKPTSCIGWCLPEEECGRGLVDSNPVHFVLARAAAGAAVPDVGDEEVSGGDAARRAVEGELVDASIAARDNRQEICCNMFERRKPQLGLLLLMG